jgi:hypothetical protein
MSGVHITINNFLELDQDTFYGVCEVIFNKLIDTTPVDTGECQAAWQIDYVDENTVEIWNDTEYLSYLEDGHSKQAPAGWIESILNSFSDIVFDYINV